MPRPATALCALLLTMWWAATLQAQATEGVAAGGVVGPRTSALHWVHMPGAEQCTSGQRLAEAVEVRLGRDTFVSAAEADLAIEGRIERTEDGYRAIIVASDREGRVLGERTLPVEGQDCAAIDEPLALVIAVMIDPDAATSPRDTVPLETVPVETVPADPPTETASASHDPPHRDTEPAPQPPPAAQGPGWRFELDGGLGAAAGLLPGLAPGLVGALVVTPPGLFPIELEGALYASVTVEAAGAGEAQFALAHGGLAVCPLMIEATPLSLGLCAGVQLGAMRLDGPPGQPPAERVIGQVLVRGRLSLKLHDRISLWLRPTLLVPVRREAFRYDDGMGGRPVLFRPAVVAATLDLGIGVHL